MLKYKNKYYDTDFLLLMFAHVVEETGMNVTVSDCRKYFEEGEYFWRKALNYLAYKNLVSIDRGKHNLIEENISERQLGFMEGYYYHKYNKENN